MTPRWRKVDELYYPDQDNAWDLIFNRGQWSQCSFVFDEDDDCNRWERVEFYEPKDLFKIGKNKGGLENRPDRLLLPGVWGLINRWRPERTQVEPKKFGTVKYTDTNNNGFIDLMEYDLGGDTLFEDRVSLLELGVDDRNEIIPTSQNDYGIFRRFSQA